MNSQRRSVARRARWVAPLLALSLALAQPITASGSGASDLAGVRDATARYHEQSVAEADGFGRAPAPAPVHECIASFDGTGGMGVHWLNFARVGDSLINANQPEVLVYEPTANGQYRLVAVEYIVDQAAWDADNAAPPVLFGHTFHLVTAPNRYEVPSFYELHAWVWKHNPSGMFEDFNPNVTCDSA